MRTTFLIPLSLASLCLPAGVGRTVPQANATLTVPAFTAYAEPDAEALNIAEPAGVTGWKDAHQKVVWYGKINATGRLHLAVRLRLAANARSTFRLTAGSAAWTAEARGTENATTVTLDFGKWTVSKPGFYRFALEGIRKTASTFGEVEALALAGPAAAGAHFNLLERRNAASVHLGYPIPKDAKVVTFYNELTVRTEPLWSYYMACGFARGYFGIQVNSPTERRIIFSVWDSGNEAVDRNKVRAEDRVQLLEKGEGVVADSFGNEGTGGHSHLVYPWKKDVAYRFKLTAAPSGVKTVYTAYFYFPEKRAWGLIARFRAPKDGNTLRGLYSFNENFGGANGQLRRLAEFGNQWIQTEDGAWQELTQARFTHDPTGRKDREDYSAGVVNGRFFLSNGGFLANGMKYGDTLRRPAANRPPH